MKYKYIIGQIEDAVGKEGRKIIIPAVVDCEGEDWKGISWTGRKSIDAAKKIFPAGQVRDNKYFVVPLIDYKAMPVVKP